MYLKVSWLQTGISFAKGLKVKWYQQVTVFMYGQTSSGKTHTMKGTASDPGLIPTTLRKLFEVQPDAKIKRAISAKMSYYEIYNETINDLLDTNKVNLEIREDKENGIFVKDLTQVDVHDFQTAMAAL